MKSILKKISIFILITIFTNCSNANLKTDEQLTTTDLLNNKIAEVRDSTTSEITCPKCGHKKVEVLPTEVCQLKYTCEKCMAVLSPKKEDCCVFCSYGDHKCPSMQ